jgi:hypothetical protein
MGYYAPDRVIMISAEKNQYSMRTVNRRGKYFFYFKVTPPSLYTTTPLSVPIHKSRFTMS